MGNLFSLSMLECSKCGSNLDTLNSLRICEMCAYGQDDVVIPCQKIWDNQNQMVKGNS